VKRRGAGFGGARWAYEWGTVSEGATDTASSPFPQLEHFVFSLSCDIRVGLLLANMLFLIDDILLAVSNFESFFIICFVSLLSNGGVESDADADNVCTSSGGALRGRSLELKVNVGITKSFSLCLASSAETRSFAGFGSLSRGGLHSSIVLGSTAGTLCFFDLLPFTRGMPGCISFSYEYRLLFCNFK